MLLGARNRAAHVLVVLVLVLIVHRDMLPIIGLSLLNISTGPCFTKRLWGHQPTTNISVKVNEVLTRRFHADGISHPGFSRQVKIRWRPHLPDFDSSSERSKLKKKFLSLSVALGEEARPEIAGRSVYETRARKDS